MSIYLDHAATTPICDEAKQAMLEAMDVYGNPSSTHASGRRARALIERVRKDIASRLNCLPAEIIFTSGGTEADNWAIRSAVDDLGVTHMYTSAMEHHAVGHSTDHFQSSCTLHIIPNDEDGVLDLDWLESRLADHSASDEKVLVTLMHANNEIGNLLDLKRVADMCIQYGAVCHSDTVQSMCHYPLDFQELKVDYAACAAHKFHGPKGVGFAFVRQGRSGAPLIHGGAQERGHRAGTENTVGIAGLGAAFVTAVDNMEEEAAHMKDVKQYAIDLLKEHFPSVTFNGLCADIDRSLYTVLNFHIPELHSASMMTFQLDINGIQASGGSACSSGSSKGSHVLAALGRPSGTRISFARFTTREDIDALLKALLKIREDIKLLAPAAQ